MLHTCNINPHYTLLILNIFFNNLEWKAPSRFCCCVSKRSCRAKVRIGLLWEGFCQTISQCLQFLFQTCFCDLKVAHKGTWHMRNFHFGVIYFDEVPFLPEANRGKSQPKDFHITESRPRLLYPWTCWHKLILSKVR